MRKAWRGQETLEWYRRTSFRKLRNNLFMLTVLFREGGYWLDYERRLTSPIADLHPANARVCLVPSKDFSVIAADELNGQQSVFTTHTVAAWIIGSVPGHPLFKEALDNFLRMAPYFDRHSSWSRARAAHALSGGGLVTRALRHQYRPNGDTSGIHICPARIDFDPLTFHDGSKVVRRTEKESDSVRNLFLFQKHRPGQVLETGTMSEAEKQRSRSKLCAEPGPTLGNVGGEKLLGDRPSTVQCKGKIPGILFQTTRSKTVLASHHQLIENFRDINFDLSHIVLDEAETDEYMFTEWGEHRISSIYRRARFGPMKADIFRYCYAYNHGGYYLDLTKAVWTRLTSLTKSSDEALISFEKTATGVFPRFDVAQRLRYPESPVVQWCFGFIPRHKILELSIERIVALEKTFGSEGVHSVRQAIFTFTGPGLLTWAVRKYFETTLGTNVAQADRYFGDAKNLERLDTSNFPFGGARHYASQWNQPILWPE